MRQILFITIALLSFELGASAPLSAANASSNAPKATTQSPQGSGARPSSPSPSGATSDVQMTEPDFVKDFLVKIDAATKQNWVEKYLESYQFLSSDTKKQITEKDWARLLYWERGTLGAPKNRSQICTEPGMLVNLTKFPDPSRFVDPWMERLECIFFTDDGITNYGIISKQIQKINIPANIQNIQLPKN